MDFVVKKAAESEFQPKWSNSPDPIKEPDEFSTCSSSDEESNSPSYDFKDVSRSSYVKLTLLLVIVIFVTLGHEIYMIITQYDLFMAAGVSIIPRLILYSIPTSVPILGGCVLCSTYLICKGLQKRSPISCMRILYFTAFLFGLMHTVQVAIFLYVDTILHIDSIPHNTSCSCVPNTNSTQVFLESCTCYVPSLQKQVVLTRTSTPIYDDVQELVDMHLTEDSSIENLKAILKKMSILLQSSILIAFLRFPLWILFNSIHLDQDLQKRLKKQSSIEKKVRKQSGLPLTIMTGDLDEDHVMQVVRGMSFSNDLESPTSENNYEISDTEAFTDIVAYVMRNLKLEQGFEQKRWLIKAQSSQEKWKNQVYAIELCYYCLVEIVDAFSLLDNLSENIETFAVNLPLTYATLFFISLSLFVGTAANFLSSHPFRSQHINRYGKSVVVVSNNVPLFILRCVIFYKSNGEENSLFFLLAMKELAILILAVVEILIVFKSPKESENDKEN